MKQLPVIQNSTQASGAAQSTAQTALMTPDPAASERLTPEIVRALSTVYDPEIPVNIYELGLVYDIIVDRSNAVGIRMTLTAPACPAAQFLPSEVAKKVGQVAGVSDVKVDIVWEPPWTKERMSDAAKLQLGIF